MQIIDPSGKPMMSDEEIKIIDDLLKKNQCKRCLEWGSGNSTVWFPRENLFIERWVAIEHNATYLELLEHKIDGRRVTIGVFPDKEEYIKAPLSFGDKFDFILVDGNWRDECIEMAFKVAKEGAIILLHDSARIESKNILEKYKNKTTILIDGEKPTETGFCAHRGLALLQT